MHISLGFSAQTSQVASWGDNRLWLCDAVPHYLDTLTRHPMTQDPNRQAEPKKIHLKDAGLCEPCSGVQRNWRRAPGHAELVQGKNRQEDRRRDLHSSQKHALVTITSYRCDRCGTAWEYENNKADQKAGWSVVGPSSN
jgi:hypothetical protein